MLRTLVVLGTLAALALVAPTGAAAATISFTGTAKVRAIEGQTLAGTSTSSHRLLGRGAVVYVTKAGPNNTVVSTFTIFAATGTLKGTATVTQTPGQPGQPTTLRGTARITSGTGVFRRGRGRFDVSGQIAPDGLITLNARNGRVTY